MTEEGPEISGTGGGSEYDLKPAEPAPARPKPGDPDWVPPTPVIEKAAPAAEEEPVDPDVQRNKGVAILGYLVFFVPLIAAPHSKFARFHANQGLLLFITWCVAITLVMMLHFGWNLLGPHVDIAILWALLGFICYVAPVGLVVVPLIWLLMGIVNAANGEQRELPLVGHWKLIK